MWNEVKLTSAFFHIGSQFEDLLRVGTIMVVTPLPLPTHQRYNACTTSTRYSGTTKAKIIRHYNGERFGILTSKLRMINRKSQKRHRYVNDDLSFEGSTKPDKGMPRPVSFETRS